MSQSTENDTRTEVQTQFLRDGEWLPHVLIRRSEIGRVKFRHRVVTITERRGEWRQGRASGTSPIPPGRSAS